MGRPRIRIVDRIVEVLKKKGPMQTVEITAELNKNKNFPTVSRGTVNTLIYNNKIPKGTLLKKVSYGRFDLANGSTEQTKDDVLEKLIILMTEYQRKMKMNDISYDTRLFGVNFNKGEISFIQSKIMKKRKKRFSI